MSTSARRRLMRDFKVCDSLRWCNLSGVNNGRLGFPRAH